MKPHAAQGVGSDHRPLATGFHIRPPDPRLDVLTFVMFQAPCSLAPLALSVVFSWEEGIWEAGGWRL